MELVTEPEIITEISERLQQKSNIYKEKCGCSKAILGKQEHYKLTNKKSLSTNAFSRILFSLKRLNTLSFTVM